MSRFRHTPSWFAMFCVLSWLCVGASCRAESERDRVVASAEPRAAAAPQPEPAKEPEPESVPLNVLLIVIDGLRADMPWTGYPRDIAPRLTKLSERAVTYTRAYALSSTTARSVAALLTGKYPSELIRDGYYFSRYYPENVFVSELVRDAGHDTLSIGAHAYFLPGTGVSQGFEVHRVLRGTHLNNLSRTNITSRRMTNLAKELLGELTEKTAEDKRFFAYLHYMDPHAPYLRHKDQPDYGKELRDLYDQEVRFTDQWVGHLLDWVKEQPWGSKTAVIVTSDHGEGFGEHGFYKHGYHLWEELIRVPLLIQTPDVKPRRVDVPRSHIDLAPTILELMGLDADSRMPGKSLVAELRGEHAEARVVVAELPRDDLQDQQRALIDDNLKLITRGDDRAWFVYNLMTDPGERRNLAGENRELFERMKSRYQEVWKTIEVEEVRGPYVPLKGAPEGRRW